MFVSTAVRYEIVEKRWLNHPTPGRTRYYVESVQEIVTQDFAKVRALAEMTATEETDVCVYCDVRADVAAPAVRECVLIVEASAS